VATQEAKKGAAAAEKPGDETGAIEEDGAVFGRDKKADVRHVKRRKVSREADDPFGPPLQG